MLPFTPVNVGILDVESTIKRYMIKPVTSHSIYEPSSTQFHPDGFFSEIIFGQIGSPARLETFGYIELNTTVFDPHYFKTLMSLKQMYQGVVTGKVFAKFDKQLKDLVVCDRDDPEGNTGYHFFFTTYPKIVLEKNGSEKRALKIDLLEKYRSICTIKKWLVQPAGIRDVREENGRATSEEINKLYFGLLSLSQSFVPGATDNEEMAPVFDGVRSNLQMKVLEIYSYIYNMCDGKHGYLQRKYANRSQVSGTRNVISAALPEAETVDDPSYIKHNETLLPIFQAAKAYQPVVNYSIRSLFYEPVIPQGATKIPLIDPDTLKIVYVEISEKEVARATTSSGVEGLINAFHDEHLRSKPVTVYSVDKKPYYLHLVYDELERIYLFRNIEDFTELMSQKGMEVDFKRVRPLTYLEMLYMATYRATRDKHVLVTRYPAIEMGSIYPSRTKIGSTVPSRVVTFSNQFDSKEVVFPHYPILGNKFQDSCIVHSSKCGALGADYDGDMTTNNGVFSEEANEEIDAYSKHPSSIATVNGGLISSANTNVTELAAYNFTRKPSVKILPTQNDAVDGTQVLVNKIFSVFNKLKKNMKQLYGWNVIKMNLRCTDLCYHPDGTIDTKSNPINCPAHWTNKTLIYVADIPRMRKIVKEHKVDVPMFEFYGYILGRELAREIYRKVLSDDKKKYYKKVIEKDGFTSPNVSKLKDDQKDEELFCEYISMMIQ